MRCQSWKVNQHLRGFFIAGVYGEELVGGAGGSPRKATGTQEGIAACAYGRPAMCLGMCRPRVA